MSGNYSITVRANGTILTASIYNSDHQNHVNNATPQGLGDYSDSVSQMQSTSDPGEVGSESLASSGAGELERLRFMLAQMSGKTHWYENPERSLEDTQTLTELEGRIEGTASASDNWGFDLTRNTDHAALVWYPMFFVGRQPTSDSRFFYIPLVKRDASSGTGREKINGTFFFSRQSGAAINATQSIVNLHATQTSLLASHNFEFWGQQTKLDTGDELEFFRVEFDWNGDTWIGLEIEAASSALNPDGFIYFSGFADLRDQETLTVLDLTEISSLSIYSAGNQETRYFGRSFDVEQRIDNSNGTALRFSGGEQICFIDDLELERPVGSGAGATMSATWTFPATFASGSTPTVNSVFAVAAAEVTLSRNDITYYGINGAPSSVSDSGVTMAVVAQSNFSEGDTTHFQLMAIGRWFG